MELRARKKHVLLKFQLQYSKKHQKMPFEVVWIRQKKMRKKWCGADAKAAGKVILRYAVNAKTKSEK